MALTHYSKEFHMHLRTIAKTGEKFVTDNSPAILTAIGVVGTVTTAILSGRAAVLASNALADAENESLPHKELDNKEKFKLLWPIMLPPVVSGAATCTAIIFANRVGTRRAAAMAAAYATSEKAYSEYRDKVVEKIGRDKEEEVRSEIGRDRLAKNPPSGQLMSNLEGRALFYDKYTGRPFPSTMETIKSAQNYVNNQLLNGDGYVSLNTFYSWLDLDNVPIGEEVGWTSEDMLDLSFATTMVTYNNMEQAAVVVEFRTEPIRNYWKAHGR